MPLRHVWKFVTGVDNRLFANMYLLKRGYGLVVDEHIYLYYCPYNILQMQEEMLPWIYMEKRRYLGDTWWYDVEEIVEDVQKLPMIEFVEKYKGL